MEIYVDFKIFDKIIYSEWKRYFAFLQHVKKRKDNRMKYLNGRVILERDLTIRWKDEVLSSIKSYSTAPAS